ncbi:PAS domain S-box protein [bacterium]|nr:PAS domain S-box protein [bacterium]
MTPRSYFPAAAVCGTTVSAIALISILGWVSGAVSLIQLGPRFPPVPLLSSLMCLAQGFALMSYSVGKPRVMQALNAWAMATSSLILLDWVFPKDLGINSLFASRLPIGNLLVPVAPNTAVCLILCGLSLLSLRLKAKHPWIAVCLSLLPWMVIAQGIAGAMGFLLDLPQTYVWVQTAGMSPQSLVSTLILALGALSITHLRTGEATLSAALFAVPTGALLVTFLLWVGIDRQQRQLVDSILSNETHALAARVHDTITRASQALERMASRFQRTTLYQNRKHWETDASYFLKHFQGVRAVAWVDSGNRLRWAYPRGEFAPFEGLDLSQDPRRRVALQKARETLRPTATGGIDLLSHERGFVVYFPIFSESKFGGFVAAAFSYDNLLERALPPNVFRDYALRIDDDREDIFSSLPEQVDTSKRTTQTVETAIVDRHWKITLAPTRQKQAELFSMFPFAMLLLGFVGSLVTSFLLYFILKSERQRASIEVSEDRFRALIESVGDYAIFMLDIEGRVMNWNEGAQRTTGYSAEEIVGQGVRLFYPKESRSTPPQIELQTAAINGKYEVTALQRRSDGSEYWAHIILSAIRDKNGELKGFSRVVRDITQVRREEERMQIALEATGIGIWDWDIVNHHVEWDAQSFRLYHLSGNQAPHTVEAWQALLHPQDAEGAVASIQESLRERRNLDIEFRIRPRGGVDRHLRMIAHGIYDAEGKPLRMLGACLDITESKRLREELQYRIQQLEGANARFELLSVGTSVGIWDWESAYNDRGYWSPTFYAILGYENQEIEASVSSFKTLLHPDDVVPTMTAVQTHLASAGGQPFSIEHRMRMKSGEYRWFHGTGATLRDSAGRVTRMVGSIHDIHQRKILEERLLRTNTSLDQIMRSSGHMLISTDLNGTIQYFNPTAEAKLGYRAEEVIGKATPELFHDPGEVKARIEKLREEGVSPASSFAALVGRADLGGTEQNEWTHIRKDGTRFPVLLTVTALSGPEGNHSGYLGTAVDLSEKKALENELQKAIEARSVFLANMSHEIRTPMNGVIGMTSMLLQCQLPPEAKEYAQTIRKSGELLLSVVNDILDISKIEAGKLVIEKTPMSIRQAVDHVIDLFGEMAERKELTLCSIVNEKVPSLILGDSVRIQQVLSNLVSNAIKFTTQGAITVRVSSVRNKTGEITVKIEVADTGIGMRPEVVARLFEPFSQGDTSTTRRFGGTGLGLSISRRLVTLMLGEIRVASEEGFGSTFTVTLPCSVASGEAARPHSLQRGGKAAIVSANVHMRRSVGELLQSMQFEHDAFPAESQLMDALRSGVVYDCYIFDGIPKEHPNQLVAKPCIYLLTPSEASETLPYAGTVLRKPLKQTQFVDAVGTAVGVRRPEAPPPNENRPRQMERLVKPNGDAPYCLVAEDNEVNQKVVVAMLSKLGIRSRVVASGTAVLQALEEDKFDLVLMDCFMPEMDGYEASKRIRLLKAPAAQIPIVAVTASATTGDREKCQRAGMDDYLAKPVQFMDLKKMLTQVLCLRTLSPARPQASPTVALSANS